jgi:hypothetical protein
VTETDPEPPVAAEWFALSFQRLANALACRLGAPVYLVGSALTSARPGDYDVRVVLGDQDLHRLFGRGYDDVGTVSSQWSPGRWRQGREQLKQSRRLSRMMRVNVDFQIQDYVDAERYADLPRLRLDKAPDGFFEAGKGDA